MCPSVVFWPYQTFDVGSAAKFYISLQRDLVLESYILFCQLVQSGGTHTKTVSTRIDAPVLLNEDSFRGTVFLVPIHIRHIGRADNILYDLPLAVDLAEQRNDTIVKGS
jgi:hypothetical protein